MQILFAKTICIAIKTPGNWCRCYLTLPDIFHLFHLTDLHYKQVKSRFYFMENRCTFTCTVPCIHLVVTQSECIIMKENVTQVYELDKETI